MANNVTIIIKKRKKSGHAVHHGGAWKVAYADFVTAMMAFFLVMWLMASDDETKASISMYFNHPGDMFKWGGDPTTTLTQNMGEEPGAGNSILVGSNGLNPDDLVKSPVKAESKTDSFREVGELINEVLGDLAFGVEIELDYLKFSIAEGVLFKPGTSSLQPKATEYLDRIGRIIQGFKGHLTIEDHSEEIKLDGRKMPSLFEASVVKSVSIMNYFVKHNWMPVEQIHPVVTQDSKRKFSNEDTPEANDKNQRVEFTFQSKKN
ncbi:MAG: flagellar motor protein MotB [Bdellovibrionia bacterium]